MMAPETARALEFIREQKTGVTHHQVANAVGCDSKRAQILVKNLSLCDYIRYIRGTGYVPIEKKAKPTAAAPEPVKAPVYTPMAGAYTGMQAPVRPGAGDAFQLPSRAGDKLTPYTGPRSTCVSRVPGNGREERIC